MDPGVMEAAMEVFEAVRTVLATREFRPEPLPSDIVQRILEAGRLTASSMNLQPWHFIAIEDREDLETLGKMAKTGPYVAGAGLAVAVAIERTKYAESDASRAVQSMILTAWEAGVASNWVGFYGLEDAKEYLGIPEEFELLAIVPFGYSDAISHKGYKKRKSFLEVVHRGRFGQAFT
jgi:nitroreductase